MDPMMNPNPTSMPTSAPTPTPTPTPGVVPPTPVSQPMGTPVAGVPPVAPPVAPIANPVIMPNAPHNGIGRDFVMSQVPDQAAGGFVNATDPITMPAPPKSVDPVEEELKAPLKAAEPVPGSIGSAISVPAPEGTEEPYDPTIDGGFPVGAPTPGKTPSVSFNDPAVITSGKPGAKPKIKKSNKKTLTALAIVAVMVVIGLATVLILQMNGIL